MENYEKDFEQDIDLETDPEINRLEIEKENEIWEFIEWISDEEFNLEFSANPKTPGEMMDNIFDLIDLRDTDCKEIYHRWGLQCNWCKYRRIWIIAEKSNWAYWEETVLRVRYKKKSGENTGYKDYTIKYRKSDNKITYQDNTADDIKKYTYKSDTVDNNKEIIDALNIVYVLLKRCGVWS